MAGYPDDGDHTIDCLPAHWTRLVPRKPVAYTPWVVDVSAGQDAVARRGHADDAIIEQVNPFSLQPPLLDLLSVDELSSRKADRRIDGCRHRRRYCIQCSDGLISLDTSNCTST